MRASLITTFLILALGTLTGCRPMTSSGIPKALNVDTLLQTAGSAQGVTLGGPSSGEGWDSRSVETERRFRVTISSGTSGQLLAAYRREVERTITGMGGEIHGRGVSNNADDVHDFSYSYTWSWNDSIIR